MTRTSSTPFGINALLALACAVGAIACGTSAQAQAPADPPEIFFSPMEGSPNENGPGVNFTTFDFPKMVASPQQWSTAAGHITALGLQLPWLLWMPPAQLPVKGLAKWADGCSYQIYSGGSLVYTAGDCVAPVMEGVTNDTAYSYGVVSRLHQWKLAGGRLDYIKMDSPFHFGYYGLAQQNVCNFSIQTVAQQAATSVNMILQDFPNAQVIDEEGPGPVQVPQFLSDYAQFVTAFNAVSHQPLSRLTLDMHYTDAWHTGYQWVPATQQIVSWGHKQGLEMGFFMDAEDQQVESPDGTKIYHQSVTAASWAKMVRQHMQLAYSEAIPLDYIMLCSWFTFPIKNLPETDPTAFTSLVNSVYDIFRSEPDSAVKAATVGRQIGAPAGARTRSVTTPGAQHLSKTSDSHRKWHADPVA